MPLSSDPDARARQLANLRPNPDNLVPGAGQWEPGATPALRSGWRTRAPSEEALSPMLDGIVEDLAAKVPVPLLNPDGSVAPWATESVLSLAVLKLAMVRIERYLAQHGDTDGRRRLRPEVELAGRAAQRYRVALDEEAMTLRSRLQTALDAGHAGVLGGGDGGRGALAHLSDDELREIADGIAAKRSQFPTAEEATDAA